MWHRIVSRMASFRSAVVSGRDPEGYPISVRCQPIPVVESRAFELLIAPTVAIQPGPASLLCHSHDAQFWRQESFLVRGELHDTGGRWVFTPVQLIPGIDQSPIAFVRFIIGCRRRAASYLRARGIPRPTIPWAAINAVKEEALGRRGRA